MREITCQHCNGSVKAGDTKCPHCGIPLPPNLATDTRRKHFIYWFIALVIFCTAMVLWLPHFD